MGYDRASFFSKKVTLFNVLATFLIVVLHAETPLRFGRELSLGSTPFVYVIFMVTQVAVPLFFFLSGLLFYKDCEWKNLPNKLYRRIFSLVIPFLIWNLFFVAVFWAISKVPFIADKMNRPADLNTVKDWLLAIWHTKFTPLWFIKYLIIFNLMSPAILLVIRNKYVGATFAIGLLAASAFLDWDSYCDILYWMPVYLSGAILGRHLYSEKRNQDFPIFEDIGSAAHRALAVSLFVILMANYFIALFNPDFIRFFRFIAPIAIWLFADCILKADFKDKFVVKDWMGYSFFIYATHHFMLNAEQALVRAYLPNTMAVVNLTFIITPVVTFVLIVLIARWLSRYKFYKYLTGGR